MLDKDEFLLKMEREFQKELDVQKKYYESQLDILRSEFEYYKIKMRYELENTIKYKEAEMKSFYDVKCTNDCNKIKEYYEKELNSQKNWYEEEIKKRQKETENWHINNLEQKLEELTKIYEEKLKILTEEFKNKESNLNNFIEEQKNTYDEQRKMYEEQIRPFKGIINVRNKIEQKLNYFSKKDNNIININENEEIPKVSVILPIYNVEKYLRQSLDSLINQTLKEIEIICVNDGSTDESYSILEEYKTKDNRIKVIHKSNEGTGSARNEGLRLAKGECIGFVDPDDWVKPDMFEKLYNEIKEKNLDISMCMPDGFDEKNKKNAPFPYFIDDNFKHISDTNVFNWKDLSPFQYPMCVWNKLYTKKLIDKYNINFAQGLDFEDHKFIFGALLRAERVFFIREKLYIYRYNREGSVLSDNNRRLIDHIKIFDIVENIMKETNTIDILRNDFLIYKVHNLLYYYSMIKSEFKKEYYDAMVNSLVNTNLSDKEYSMLEEKYPELKEIIKR